ncbi:MAG: hypothetical protein AAF253_02740 [Pseudomonadota bacterium]
MTPTHHARKFTVPCTITVSHTYESLEAHVELAGDIRTEVGDRITVHGQAVGVPYGETTVIERMATVRRANWLERAWVRFTAYFELTELYEVSFSPGSLK